MSVPQNPEKTMMLFSITERGSGRHLMELLNERKIKFHLQFTGSGTASSEMMSFLGLGSSDKDIIVSFATQRAMKQLAAELNDNLNAFNRGKGIMMMLSPSAISHLAAVIIARQTGELPEKEGNDMLKSEFKHSLIFIAANQGYTEQIMQTVKKAGATGGTIIRARLAGAENPEQFHGVTLQGEKEIITILAPDSIRNQILEDVNKEFGLRTETQAIICSLPVEKAFKI